MSIYRVTGLAYRWLRGIRLTFGDTIDQDQTIQDIQFDLTFTPSDYTMRYFGGGGGADEEDLSNLEKLCLCFFFGKYSSSIYSSLKARSLPNDEILNISKLQAFADDKLNEA